MSHRISFETPTANGEIQISKIQYLYFLKISYQFSTEFSSGNLKRKILGIYFKIQIGSRQLSKNIDFTLFNHEKFTLFVSGFFMKVVVSCQRYLQLSLLTRSASSRNQCMPHKFAQILICLPPRLHKSNFTAFYHHRYITVG